MSRFSALATDTGTAAATFALAEAGLGSLPPQPDQHRLSKKIRPIKDFACQGSRGVASTGGFATAKLCPSPAAFPLPVAVVIRRPLSAGKRDEFPIIAITLYTQGLDVQIPTQVSEYCAPDGRRPSPIIIVPYQSYPQIKEVLEIFTKIYLR